MARRPGRRLFFDLETSPNVALVWQAGRKLTVPHENIIRERAIICACWKWEGERRVQHAVWSNNQSDRGLLLELVPMMNAACEIVAHNGDRFDIPWVRTRCLYQGISCPPDFISLDTLKAARYRFFFNSNRLDYLGKFLDLGGKKSVGFDLWKRITIDNDRDALAKMVRYCERDVRLLERVFLKLNPFIRPNSSRAEYIDQCPECGSDETVIQKHRLTAAGHRYVQFQCRDCGKYHQVAQSRFDKSRKMRDVKPYRGKKS